MRVISYGGGVQSTALVVLAATGRLDADCAVFSNVGENAEHPDTLRYVREVAIPWAAERGFEVTEDGKVDRAGTPVDLWDKLNKEGSRSIPIPVRGPRTGAPGTRSCTVDFKIVVLDRWARARGATKEAPFTKLMGFSTDEFTRAGGKRTDYTVPEYPLLTLGLDRSGCAQVIRDAGLPVPPKSSCFFCPFHRPQTWAEQRRDHPVLFRKSADLEATLNARRATLRCPTSGALATVEELVQVDAFDDGVVVEVPTPPGESYMCPKCEETVVVDPDGNIPEHMKGPMFLTRFGKPLAAAIPEAQTPLFFDDDYGDGSCDDGGCGT